MKELVCFTIGLVVGAVVMKKSQAIDELKRELDCEKFRNRPSTGTEQTCSFGHPLLAGRTK